MRKPIVSLGLRVGRSGEEFHGTVTRWVENGRDPEIREKCLSLADIYEKELDRLIARPRPLKPTPENERRVQRALEHKATLTHHAGFLTNDEAPLRPYEGEMQFDHLPDTPEQLDRDQNRKY